MPYHHVNGVQGGREAILEAFWEFMEAHNGNRRRDPREFIHPTKVIGNVVHYKVDADVLRAIRNKGTDGKEAAV